MPTGDDSVGTPHDLGVWYDPPDGCQTEGCHRETEHVVSALNPGTDGPSRQERAMCGPCYDMFNWCAGVPYGDHSHRRVIREEIR